MNYRKIARFIKNSRQLIIWNLGKTQYISDSIAVYPVFGMPKMNEAEMLTFLGLADKVESISVRVQDAPDWLSEITYNACDENIIEKTGPQIILSGEIYRTFYHETGAIVSKNDYFDVVERGVSKEVPVIQCLIDSGVRGIAVFAGFVLYAVILPISPKGLYHEYIKLATMLQTSEQNEILNKISKPRAANHEEG